MTQGGGGVG